MSKQISWEQVNWLIAKLAVQIKANNIKNIYGIPRGGLIPAVMLSHQLDKPLILKEEEIGPDTLVVDELTDTGKAFTDLGERLGSHRGLSLLRTATLYHSPSSIFKPLYYAETKDSEWLVMPWEKQI